MMSWWSCSPVIDRCLSENLSIGVWLCSCVCGGLWDVYNIVPLCFLTSSKDELAPFPWPCKSVKRVRSSTHGHTDWSHLLYRNLPLEVEKKRANHGSQSSLAWKDDYLQHDDLKNLPRSRDVFHKIEVDPELTMELPKPGSNAGRILEHAVRVFEQLVSKLQPLTFKFGITHDASTRWHNSKFGYKHSRGDKFDHMIVLYGSSNCHGPAFLEAALIDKFQGYLFAVVFSQ